MKSLLTTILAAAAIFSACSKTDDHGPSTDKTAPEIELVSPQQNASFKVGDTIRIKGRMWDNKDLHEAGIYVSCPDHLTTKMDCHMHVHKKKEHHFDTTYVVKHADSHHNLRLKITAEDHDHNKSEKVLEITVLQ